MQLAVTNNPDWTIEDVKARLSSVQRAAASVFSLRELNRGKAGEFSAVIVISEFVGRKQGFARVTQDTNAATGNFEIEDAE